MAFTYSLDDFAVTFFVTGNGFSTLSVEIYSRARQGISLEINALSALVFLFSMILVVGYYFISKDNTPKRLKKMRREQSEVAKLKWKITVTFYWNYRYYCHLVFGVRQLEKASGMAGADTLTIYNWGLYRSSLD